MSASGAVDNAVLQITKKKKNKVYTAPFYGAREYPNNSLNSSSGVQSPHFKSCTHPSILFSRRDCGTPIGKYTCAVT